MIVNTVRLTIKINRVAQVRDYCKHIVNCFQKTTLKPRETKQFRVWGGMVGICIQIYSNPVAPYL